MKRIICALVLAGLICAGLLATAFVKENQTGPGIGEVLRAHNAPNEPQALSAFVIEAVKLTSIEAGPSGDLPNFFERKVSVATDGRAFKRRKVDPLGIREQFDLFDGQQAYRAVLERGRLVEESEQVEDSQFESVRFIAGTFGLAPILKQLSAPRAAIVYVGRTALGGYRFEVKADIGALSVFTDRQYVIRKVEAGAVTIEYADYRLVDGVKLPFIQRVYRTGRLMYEMVFTGIDLKPEFPDSYFSRESILEQPVR